MKLIKVYIKVKNTLNVWVIDYHKSNAKHNINVAFYWNKWILTTTGQKEMKVPWEKSWKHLCAGICTQFDRALLSAGWNQGIYSLFLKVRLNTVEGLHRFLKWQHWTFLESAFRESYGHFINGFGDFNILKLAFRTVWAPVTKATWKNFKNTAILTEPFLNQITYFFF